MLLSVFTFSPSQCACYLSSRESYHTTKTQYQADSSNCSEPPIKTGESPQRGQQWQGVIWIGDHLTCSSWELLLFFLLVSPFISSPFLWAPTLHLSPPIFCSSDDASTWEGRPYSTNNVSVAFPSAKITFLHTVGTYYLGLCLSLFFHLDTGLLQTLWRGNSLGGE